MGFDWISWSHNWHNLTPNFNLTIWSHTCTLFLHLSLYPESCSDLKFSILITYNQDVYGLYVIRLQDRSILVPLCYTQAHNIPSIINWSGTVPVAPSSDSVSMAQDQVFGWFAGCTSKIQFDVDILMISWKYSKISIIKCSMKIAGWATGGFTQLHSCCSKIFKNQVSTVAIWQIHDLVLKGSGSSKFLTKNWSLSFSASYKCTFWSSMWSAKCPDTPLVVQVCKNHLVALTTMHLLWHIILHPKTHGWRLPELYWAMKLSKAEKCGWSATHSPIWSKIRSCLGDTLDTGPCCPPAFNGW